MILICYDGSDSAKHALTVAHETLGDRPVTLLHVWSPPQQVLPDAFGDPSRAKPSVVELERFALERAQQIVQDGCVVADELGLPVTPRVEQSASDTPVWQTILDVATDVEADLIVTGTHGATAMQPALLGSVSSGVAHHSERPMLIVPAAPD